MAVIQFSHANGFPSGSYQYFFEQLKPHSVEAVPIYGLGKYRLKNDWRIWADELIEAIEHHGKGPVVGLGHSLGGAITIAAAQKRPDLFSRIILFDPPIFGWKRRLLLGISKSLGVGLRIIPIAKQALNRKDHFQNLEEARTYWGKKRFFRDFHPQCFEDYLHHGLTPDEDGLTLSIPKALEAKIFTTGQAYLGTIRLSIPSHYLYATQGVLTEAEIKAQPKHFPDTQFHAIEGGHMFPLEEPEATATFIKELLKSEQ
ncbi:MAG: alpha/beta hydrolase [Bacteroidota bacterium]